MYYDEDIDIDKINEDDYSDRVDMSFEISLYEYGLVRNPTTNHVIFCLNTYEVEKYGMTWDYEFGGGPVPEYDWATINYQDMVEALEEQPDGYFKFIGETKKEALENLHSEYLTHHIQSLNMYNGWFDPRY